MNFKKIILFIGIFVSIGPAFADLDSRLPADWYELPENSPVYKFENGSTPDADAQALSNVENSVNEIFSGNEKIFEKVAASSDKIKRYKWVMDQFVLSLGTGLSGTMGLVVVGGTPSVEVYYTKKKKTNGISASGINAPTFVDAGNPQRMESVDVNINENMTDADLDKQAEDLTKLASKTTKVKDQVTLKKNVKINLKNFLELTRVLNETPTADWSVGGFELEMILSGAGQVYTGFFVGGDLRVRLFWKRQKIPHATTSSLAVEKNYTQSQKEMAQFVTVMSNELSSAASSATFAGYRLDVFKVGVGVSADGKFGLARAKASGLGFVHFKPVPKKIAATPRTSAVPEFIYLISDADENHLAYAKSQNIPYELERFPVAHGNVLYKISRERLNKGLSKSFRMANFFVRMANKRPASSWYISIIKMRFDLSVSGLFPFVTVGGVAATEVVLKKDQ